MDLGFNIVSTKSQVGTLNLTLVYTRWQEQTKKWGLLYPTFGTTFRIQKVGMKNKEPSGDFVPDVRIH